MFERREKEKENSQQGNIRGRLRTTRNLTPSFFYYIRRSGNRSLVCCYRREWFINSDLLFTKNQKIKSKNGLKRLRQNNNFRTGSSNLNGQVL
jgi:hypothetical protein